MEDHLVGLCIVNGLVEFDESDALRDAYDYRLPKENIDLKKTRDIAV